MVCCSTRRIHYQVVFAASMWCCYFLSTLFLAASWTTRSYAAAWTSLGTHTPHYTKNCATVVQTQVAARSRVLFSTPFEADYYDNPFQDSEASSSPLKVDPSTKLVLGLNKYSHDAGICAANANTGEVLFSISKERLSRKKHDGGNVASCVEACLDALELDLEAIETVVVNNHHHRVLPLEQSLEHMQWESGLQINGGAEAGYEDEENTLNFVPEKYELSHHLAHVYSTATQCPFGKGMVVVMDGMGETYRTMKQALEDDSYTSDFSLGISFECVPNDLDERASRSPFDWREAESVYTFEKQSNGISITPIFKRFVEEKTPPTLYNHGFENMDSVGALYSRASSHIFGDWNACGKVMGLAPWHVHSWDEGSIRPVVPENKVMWGKLWEDGGFETQKSSMMGIPLAVRSDPDLFDKEGNMVRKRRYDFDDDNYKPVEADEMDEPEITVQGEQANDMEEPDKKRLPTKVALDAISLSSRIQTDLEDVVMDFVRHFKKETGQENLCLAGGVALNSVLNGRLCRELGFKQTYISPYPGDEGIAVGCCAFGLYGGIPSKAAPPPKIWGGPLSPYLGPDPTELEMKRAMEEAAPWLEVEAVRNDGRRFEIMAQELESGGVVAWYHGRSEVGPRALGHRSILADPRKSGLVRFINQYVKQRESFRPFAPSVLAEEAPKWFDLGNDVPDPNVSPYMSLTAYVKEAKRKQIPAVTHVDGSSRLQTVTKSAEPLYHQLISAFYKLTGVPMVLNTSFNTLPGEPIVESPKDAIRSFLCSMGSIEMLVMGDYIIKRKQPGVRALLGETRKDSNDIVREPSCPKRAGPLTFESTFSIQDDEVEEADIDTASRVRMPSRPMHHEGGEWFELVDELEGELLALCDGTVQMNDIMAHFTASPEDQELKEDFVQDTQTLIQNIVSRLVRLYEHTLISW